MFRRSGYRFADKNMRHSTNTRACSDSNGTEHALGEEQSMPLRADWSYPTSVRFGAGRIAELGEAVRAAAIAKPLFVTDPTIAALPMTEAAMAGVAGSRGPARPVSAVAPKPRGGTNLAGVAALRGRGGAGAG